MCLGLSTDLFSNTGQLNMISLRANVSGLLKDTPNKMSEKTGRLID